MVSVIKSLNHLNFLGEWNRPAEKNAAALKPEQPDIYLILVASFERSHTQHTQMLFAARSSAHTPHDKTHEMKQTNVVVLCEIGISRCCVLLNKRIRKKNHTYKKLRQSEHEKVEHRNDEKKTEREKEMKTYIKEK